MKGFTVTIPRSYPAPKTKRQWDRLFKRLATNFGAPLRRYGKADWHPPATKKEDAVSRMKTLIVRLRSAGDDYNADIAECEILPYIQKSK